MSYFSSCFSIVAMERAERLPIFKFVKGGKIITLIGSCHEAPLREALDEEIIQWMLKEHHELYIEHKIDNMALEFLRDSEEFPVENKDHAWIDERSVRILQLVSKRNKNLINGFHNYDVSNPILVDFNYNNIPKLKPWAADLLVSTQLVLKIMSETGGGMEVKIAELFSQHGKPIKYLENYKDIYDAFEKHHTDIEQIKINFMPTLLCLANDEEYQLAKSARTSTKGCTIESAKNMSTKHPPSVGERNMKWVETINNIPDHTPTLIVIGFGHLSGQHGLIKLLGDKGWQLVD